MRTCRVLSVQQEVVKRSHEMCSFLLRACGCYVCAGVCVCVSARVCVILVPVWWREGWNCKTDQTNELLQTNYTDESSWSLLHCPLRTVHTRRLIKKIDNDRQTNPDDDHNAAGAKYRNIDVLFMLQTITTITNESLQSCAQAHAHLTHYTY